MSGFFDKIKGADFTGLNRAFGKGKHSPRIPNPNTQYEARGISGGPISNSDSRSRSGKGFGKIADTGTNSGSVLDDEDTGPLQLVIRSLAVFFLAITTFIYIAIASFQKKWKVGPSGLTGLAIFVLVQALLHSLALLLVPQIYERTDMLRGFARAIRLTRIQFIVYGTQTGLTLILSLAATISAYTGGCKNPSDDPHHEKADYMAHLNGFCRNKRAAAAFWWFSFLTFATSLAILFKSWYSIRKLGPKHPSFEPPQVVGARAFDDEDVDDDFNAEDIHHPAVHSSRHEMSDVRPSNVGGYYGERPVFEVDHIPSGYGGSAFNEVVSNRPTPPQMTTYKDPFDEIRAQIYQTGR